MGLFSSDPCLATDCKYANKFHFHCLFGNCKYVCKTSGKAESHCLDHINPNNNLVNVRDQFAYYSLQCLCPNQVRPTRGPERDQAGLGGPGGKSQREVRTGKPAVGRGVPVLARLPRKGAARVRPPRPAFPQPEPFGCVGLRLWCFPPARPGHPGAAAQRRPGLAVRRARGKRP